MIDPVRAAQPISHQTRLQPKSPGARLRLLHRRHLHRRRDERSCPAKSICGPLAVHAAKPTATSIPGLPPAKPLAELAPSPA